MCFVCGGQFLGHDSRSFGGRYFCPADLAALTTDFDPQPNQTVRFIDGDDREWVVLARRGDTLDLRLLGAPESATIPDVSVHCLWGRRS
jgi:hypothetical protein